jgi:hypothetical protein
MSSRIPLATGVAIAILAGQAFAHINEQAKIVPVDLGAGDRFGAAVTMHGHHAIVGAPFHDAGAADGGAVYVYLRTGSVWSEEAKIIPADNEAGDQFGSSLFMHDDILVIGAVGDDDNGLDSGSVYVYSHSAGVWTEDAKLLAPDGLAGDAFGSAVSMSHESILVGAPLDDTVLGVDAGTVHVFTESLGVWSHEAQIEPAENEGSDLFGTSVSIVEDLAVVGAPGDDDKGGEAGAVYAFERSLGVWSLNIKLRPFDDTDDGMYGAAVVMAEAAHHSGGGEEFKITVGAPGDDLRGSSSGAAYQYTFEDDAWKFNGKFAATSTLAGDRFGEAVASNGETYVIGSRLDDEAGPDTGIAFAFTPEGGGEIDEEFLSAQGRAPGDEVGNAVAMDGCWGLIGAQKDGGAGLEAGAAYVFLLRHPSERYCTAGVSASGCVGRMNTNGFPSASEPMGFVFRATSIQGGSDGIFVFGVNGRAATPWGNSTSTHCVLGPRQRMGVQTGNGTPGQCNGRIVQDFSTYLTANPSQNPGAGATVNAQFWYRDPFSTSNRATSLTDAVEFELCE